MAGHGPGSGLNPNPGIGMQRPPMGGGPIGGARMPPMGMPPAMRTPQSGLIQNGAQPMPGGMGQPPGGMRQPMPPLSNGGSTYPMPGGGIRRPMPPQGGGGNPLGNS